MWVFIFLASQLLVITQQAPFNPYEEQTCQQCNMFGPNNCQILRDHPNLHPGLQYNPPPANSGTHINPNNQRRIPGIREVSALASASTRRNLLGLRIQEPIGGPVRSRGYGNRLNQIAHQFAQNRYNPYNEQQIAANRRRGGVRFDETTDENNPQYSNSPPRIVRGNSRGTIDLLSEDLGNEQEVDQPARQQK